MRTKELEEYLKEKGFKEERLDSGCNYTQTVEHIKLICYVEPEIEIDFITIYSWDNNDVKGTHNLSIAELEHTKESVATLFRKTKGNLPQHIGETIDTHEAAEEAIEHIFG